MQIYNVSANYLWMRLNDFEPLSCKPEHIAGNVSADPTAAAPSQMFPDASNAAADFQNDIRGINADIG